MKSWLEKVQMAIAWRMPRWLVYWCAIRLMTKATTGPYGWQIVPNLKAMDALKRWGEKIMEHAALQSSALRSATYDDNDTPGMGRLDVTFTNGRTYTHARVPRATWEALKDAGSPGTYYLQNIKGSF